MELEQVFDYEERFRVDRRKLESLILGRFEPIKETASDYFLRVYNSELPLELNDCIFKFL